MANRWEMRSASVGSLDTNVLLYKNPRFHLHLIQKTSEPSDRPVIQSTKFERLSFYRALTASASKTEIVMLPHVDLNVFIWFYVMNVFFKTLPHSFVHFFIAAYAPEEHVFLAKMVPICYGFIFMVIIAAFLELAIHVDTVLLLFHYVADGIMRQNPWNRCFNASYYDEKLKVIMNCYEMEDFALKTLNTTVHYEKFAYVTPDNEIFQISQIEYYRLYATEFIVVRDITYFVILWIGVAFFHTQVVKRKFWRVLNLLQWAINAVDLLTFIFLITSDKETTGGPQQEPSPPMDSPSIFSSKFWAADVDLIAESITAPAVIHILTSRSTQEINPSQDSAQMAISNGLIYMFRALLSIQVKEYVESVVHTEIHLVDFYQRAWFYFWPMFYANFFLGNIFTILFLGINGFVEFMVLSVTYYCLVETITYEWVRIKTWMIKIALTGAGLIMFCFTSIWTRAILFIYGKGIATLTEAVCLYLLYPLGRLVDDYTFHFGAPPTQLRIISLRLVPAYYMFKWYFLMEAVWAVMKRTEFAVLVPHYFWSWTLLFIPLLLGILYTIYEYLIVMRMTCQYIFRPRPKWGPRDFSERQLRKQFSSKYYISSEVPRLLSRYLLSKRESKVYKVDVRYDVQRRSTVSKAVGFGALIKKSEDKKIKVM